MLNIMEVRETNQMIEQEKLDVRTITMGISLLDCAADSVDKVCDNIYDKITTYAKDLVATGEAIERELRHPDRQQAHHRHPDLAGRRELMQERGTISSRSRTRSIVPPRKSAST